MLKGHVAQVWSLGPHLRVRAVLERKGIIESQLATQRGIYCEHVVVSVRFLAHSKVNNQRAFNKRLSRKSLGKKQGLATMGTSYYARPEEERGGSGFWNWWRKLSGESCLKSRFVFLGERITTNPHQPRSVGWREINTRISLSSHLPISWTQPEVEEQ